MGCGIELTIQIYTQEIFDLVPLTSKSIVILKEPAMKPFMARVLARLALDSDSGSDDSEVDSSPSLLPPYQNFGSRSSASHVGAKPYEHGHYHPRQMWTGRYV